METVVCLFTFTSSQSECVTRNEVEEENDAMGALSGAEAMIVVLPSASCEIEQQRSRALAACMGQYHPNICVTTSRMQVNNFSLAL